MRTSNSFIPWLGLLASAWLLAGVLAPAADAAARPQLRIPVSRSDVVSMKDDVRTVAIADPHIADAAVGSAKTVVVNAKSPGTTSLVVYTEGGAYTIYDVVSYVPNADRQVLLHVRVSEVTDEAKKTLGFDWFTRGTNGGHLEGGLYTSKVASPSIPLSIGPTTEGIASWQNAAGDFFLQGTWRALEDKGLIRTLANPALLARSGEKASFLAGGEFPVPVASASGPGGAVTVTIEWKEYGVKVDFTPTVHEDGTITLLVAPEVSRLDFTNPLTLAGFVVPSLITRRASTSVELSGGEHLVIGGLQQNDRTKSIQRVPGLGEIPLLGALFSSTQTRNTGHELVLIVSPEIVEPTAGALPAMPTDRPEGK